jgi:hypothetical protein
MRFLSSIKKLNYDMIIYKTFKLSIYTGALTGTTGGIHAAYKFSPDKSSNLPYNSMVLTGEVLKDIYMYGFFGLVNGFIWPISIPCWIISTVKYVKKPQCVD